MDKYSFLNAAHTAHFADMYEQYQQDPDSIEPSWKAFFQGYDFGSESYGSTGEIVEIFKNVWIYHSTAHNFKPTGSFGHFVICFRF